MPAVALSLDDLTPFAPDIPGPKAEALIADALALAARVAPCLFEYEEDDEPSELQVAAAKAILRGAILRWNEAGAGVLQSETIGPFSHSMDTRSNSRGHRFWPSEIQDLQGLCQGGESSGAFAIDTAPAVGNAGHADVCALNFGATYCSCGAVLTAGLYPLYEYDSLPQ